MIAIRNRCAQVWLRFRGMVPTIIACLLVGIGISLAIRNERLWVAQRADQATVQAKIMASALTGALAFDDASATREYLDALQLNPAMRAAAVYSRSGRLVAGFTKDGAPLPAMVAPHSAAVNDLMITVVEPVREGSLDLGTVYVEANIEPLGVRLSRYLAVGLIISFAALLIFLLGRSYGRVAEANDQLRAEISARQQAEQALLQAQKMEALGHLTGGIAHDFNNLLMAASSGLELFERTSNEARRLRYIQGMKEALDRGARLTRQLLTFARHSPVNAEVIDVGVRLRGIEDLLERSLRGDIAVSFDLDDKLWPVCVDPIQFEVAVVNIAVNARDAMPDGGKITISARNVTGVGELDEAVCVAIADQGCGMAPDVVSKVFDPFFTTKGVGQGTGLGLSQVYGFVRSAGGHVEIESAPTRGTTLTLFLPRCRTNRTGPLIETKDAETPAVRAQTVLVVEDDPRIAETLCELLQHLGCSSLWACAPEAALKLIAANSIEVVLSDMVMPGGTNGLELAKALRDQAEPLRVILMTGYSDDAQRAREAGFQLLDKPFTFAALAEALNAGDIDETGSSKL